MGHEEDPTIPESTAREIWRRASERQASEADSLSEPEGPSPDPYTSEGLTLDTVRKAAIEAGIDERFVDEAVAEVRRESILPVVRADRSLAHRFFGGLLDAVVVTRVIRAAPATVLASALRVFPREAYRLKPSGLEGDPLQGGFLVFDIEGVFSLSPAWLAKEVSTSAVRQVYVSVRETGEGGTELTLQGPIAYSHNAGLGHGLAVTGLSGGASGLAAGGATAAALAGVLTGPIGLVAAGGVALVGAVTGGALGRQAYRAYCRWGIERARRALEKTLLAVVVEAEQGGGG